eukprot:393819_1
MSTNYNRNCIKSITKTNSKTRNGRNKCQNTNNFNEIKKQFNEFQICSTTSTLIELIEDGFGFADALGAIQLSINVQDSNNPSKQQSDMDEYDRDLCYTDDSIQLCPHFNRLVNTMKTYYQNIASIERINMSKLIDDYLHLINKHDNNNDFTFIVNK